MIDYHVHTSLCNHASGTMKEYVQAALEKGLKTLCFLDHLTFQKAGRHNAMDPRQVPGYVDEARRLRRTYRGRIDVRVGLEVDFSPRYVERCIETINALDLDVVGGSVHFLDGEDVVSRRSAWFRGELDPDRVYQAYLATLESMLDYDYFDVVCHMDLPKKYGIRPSPRAMEGFAGVLEKIRQKDRVVELNTNGFYCPVEEAFPSPEMLGRCARLGIPVTFGSDAHSPETVGRDFERARDLLKAAGYRHLTEFRHRRRESLAI